MSTVSNDGNAPDLASEEALRAAYVRVAKHESPQSELQAEVSDFAAQLRTANLAPEKALIRLKRVLADRAGSIQDSRMIDVRSPLNEQIVRWFIEEYYRPQSP